MFSTARSRPLSRSGGQPKTYPQAMGAENGQLTWPFLTSPQSTVPTTTATVLIDKTKK